ncbi:MAG: RimK/LysX family protein [Deferribacterota bacterium]|nr:RimK/LysX family protein [Deferribacterota bacterium]
MRRISKLSLLFITILVLTTLNLSAAEKIMSKSVFGFYENIVLIPYGVKLKAKMDTGADTSSIHGEDINIIEEEDKKFVKFHFEWEEDGKEKELDIKAPFVRFAYYEQKDEKDDEKRPVVLLTFCFDGKKYEDEFSIANRSGFSSPVLLGRSLMKKNGFVIDPKINYKADINKCSNYLKDEKTDNK